MQSGTVKSYLTQLLEQALKELEFDWLDVQITRPDEKFGDYATNVALAIAKRSTKNPEEIARLIIEKLKYSSSLFVQPDKYYKKDSKIDASLTQKKEECARVFSEIFQAGGFINFRLSPDALLKNLDAIHRQKGRYGSSNTGRNQKILVEYFQPNIAKPLHLGHLRTAIIGDCLFRLFEFTGFRPESDTHLGDWGTQFGLLLHAYKKYGDIATIEKDPINELNKLYVKINTESEQDPAVREQGKAEFVKLEKGDAENRALWQKFKNYSLREFEIIYRDLGIRRADHDWPESFFEDKMPKVLDELKAAGLLKESQGAKIVDLTNYNLGVALLVKSDGGTTYLLRDLATLIYRKSQGFEKQYYVVDVRQSHTLQQTFKIVELLGYIKPGDAIHVAYGFLTLPEGAMSTRKGTVIGVREFLAGVRARALEIIKEKNPDLPEKDKVAQIVAAGAIKYFDLSHNLKSDIVFDPKKAISFEGNTGPYLQYTHARIYGILRKARDNTEVNTEKHGNLPLDSALDSASFRVLRKLHQFPEIVEQAAENLQPNTIANYLFELAQSFNAFYQEVPVLQEKDGRVKSFRLNLIIATAQVIKNGLSLLGIEAPEEM